ncbi:MAG: bifunctional nuclease family protein [Acidimicrobiia bacterium]|nr:bifunctional nuclease family protein [Acidimicrobiia bacterium]
MIRVTLIGVRVEVPSNQPIMLLREVDGQRYLPIFIGSPEATAIVYALQGMETPRPMTHDLFVTVMGDFQVELRQVAITALQDGTFYAELELVRDGAVQRISSRPSDAIALAVRLGDELPILVSEDVFEEAGVLFEEEQEEEEIEEFRAFLDEITPEDFA